MAFRKHDCVVFMPCSGVDCKCAQQRIPCGMRGTVTYSGRKFVHVDFDVAYEEVLCRQVGFRRTTAPAHLMRVWEWERMTAEDHMARAARQGKGGTARKTG